MRIEIHEALAALHDVDELGWELVQLRKVRLHRLGPAGAVFELLQGRKSHSLKSVNMFFFFLMKFAGKVQEGWWELVSPRTLLKGVTEGEQTIQQLCASWWIRDSSPSIPSVKWYRPLQAPLIASAIKH